MRCYYISPKFPVYEDKRRPYNNQYWKSTMGTKKEELSHGPRQIIPCYFRAIRAAEMALGSTFSAFNGLHLQPTSKQLIQVIVNVKTKWSTFHQSYSFTFWACYHLQITTFLAQSQRAECSRLSIMHIQVRILLFSYSNHTLNRLRWKCFYMDIIVIMLSVSW